MFRALLAIFRRRYTNGTWYTSCVLCQLVVSGLEWNSHPDTANWQHARTIPSAVCVAPSQNEQVISLVVRKMPGYNSQGGARPALPNFPFSVLCVLFVRKCVMYCCHRVSTKCVMYCCHRVSTKCVMYCCQRVSTQLRLNTYVYIKHVEALNF
jgi:hypothetical protein